LLAAALLALLVVVLSVVPASAAGLSPAVRAAQAGGTPVVPPPPPPPKPKPSSCTVSVAAPTCDKSVVICKTSSRHKTCVTTSLSCVLDGPYMRCLKQETTCKGLRDTPDADLPDCHTSDRRKTATRVAAIASSGALPRMTFSSSGPSDPQPSDTGRLIATTNAPAAPATVASASSSTGSMGAAVGVLILAAAMLAMVLGWRRPFARRR
jgi:hypothetical protein